MYFLVVGLTLISLVAIAYQDYSSRSVHWILFPLMALGGIMLGALELRSINPWLTYPVMNLAFLLLQWLLLKAYFVIRHKSKEAIIDQRIGLGDILFLIAAAFFFSPLNFILFYLLSLMFSFVIWLLRNLLTSSGLSSVPLAGLQALFLLMLMSACLIWKFSFYNDDWLMTKIAGL